MTILDKNIIDSIGTRDSDGAVNLVISDHLSWSDEVGEHLLALQDKLNSYIGFIESSEIYSTFPAASGKRLVINIYFNFPPSAEGISFLSQVESILNGIGVGLETTVLDS
ncbi:hypothetical protein THUN1379_06630 [Paludibacterium sp. THUN1379]|uniref:DUF6572 domain-containing protein n=1 Tax=Paludibacterium sp. THUN1379 TaxID=3112107 RepID=UPI00308DAEF4|nr:hypothetical protein THUN1379_06630 [Paludibacterium sp. THUN1379]